MSGIAGELAFDRVVDSRAVHLAAQREALYRRGPDQGGSYCDGKCALLHRRLALGDENQGQQPYIENGLVLAYDGALTNGAALRRELLSLGFGFSVRTECELIAKAYEAWGADCVSRFRGGFALAIYEEKAGRLFLARDQMGLKPLFYGIRDQSLVFASELKALLRHPLVEPQVSREGLYDLVFLGPGRTPGLGIFRDVRELLPGQWGVYDRQGWVTEAYWQLRDGECQETFEEASEQVQSLVTESIESQLHAAVPLCAMVSGGLDSSVIAAVAAQKLGTLDTFSVDYADNDRYFTPGKFQPNADNPYIAQMVDFLGSNHQTVTLDVPSLVEALPLAADGRDLPGMADVDASLLLFCRELSRSHPIALSGECADELFGGYPWYRDEAIRSQEGFPWAQTTDYRAEFLNPDWLTEGSPRDYVHSRYAATLKQVDCLPEASPLERRMKEMMVLNLQWFMATLAERQDRMSQYWGMEIRAPFCNADLAQYLYVLPWEYKDYKGREKGLLRHAFRSLLPREILERKKSPYPKTWNPQYREAVADLLRQVLEEPDCPLLALFQKDRLLALCEEDRSLPWYGQLMTTPQTMAYFLQWNHWLKKHKITIV